MSTRPIRFFHRGTTVEVTGVSTTRTVLDWLREEARCTGTKEGCNEGDCGACTVVVAELAGAEGAAAPDAVGALRLRSTNACLQYLPALDGKALFTVEDLQAGARWRLAADAAALPPGTGTVPFVALGARPALGAARRSADRSVQLHLHPVQQAMVDCHGSQCGFCTPGFVMSLWAAYEHHRARGTRPARQEIADELSGNLCRCTGYRPILDAGERMFDLPGPALDGQPVVAALEAMRSDETFRYDGPDGGEFVAPRTLDAFAAERAAHPDARILAGATDIGLWTNKMFRELPSLLYIGQVDELKTIEKRDGWLAIGAAASLEDAWRALVARWPTLTDVWLRFAGVPLRHSGTMGGNIANGSPIGDSAPVLMALDARLVLRRGEAVRRLALADFYAGYMKNRLEPGEFVQAIEVPLGSPAEHRVPAGTRFDIRAYKISKRFDCDISAVCAGLAIEIDATKNVASAARFAFGGMAAVVQRAARAEAAVVGRAWTKATIDAAQAALAEDFAPLTDMRASAAYRLQVAQNTLLRFWLETRAESPLTAAETSVWNVMREPASLP